MTAWWLLAAGAGVLALGCVAGLVRFRRRQPLSPGYIVLPPEIEPSAPLLHSQIAASLLAMPRGQIGRFGRAWGHGLGDVQSELHDQRQQLRTLQTYVLALDERYVRREEASWLNLQVFLLVFGALAAAATLAWAVIELAT